MNILIACEESQRVCTAFRMKGHNAYSCDMIPCSGGHPEWHIIGDALNVLNGNCYFILENQSIGYIKGNWDMIIAHPPCTYLAVSGNRWFDVEKYGEKAVERERERERAIDFFMQFVGANCERIAIENPIGCMSSTYRKPDQIIQPWQYGHPYTKSTCLWLKGLPKLIPTNILEKPETGWENQSFTKDGRCGGFNSKFSDAKTRSKTFEGIAQAMADQWG